MTADREEDAGQAQPAPLERLVVDGMNVMGARPDGWWRDRDGAVRRLVAELAAMAAAGSCELTVVLDGRPLPDLPPGPHAGIEVRYAERGGPDAADDVIVELVRADPAAANLRVVTADRALRERVQGLGAVVVGPTELLARLPH